MQKLYQNLKEVKIPMNVEYINPFIQASRSVLKTTVNMEISVGKVYLKTAPYSSNYIAIMIGLMGKLKGQVIINMDKPMASKIASGMMMGMPVNELDEISKSAVAEAANMILGNAATIFYNQGIKIEITPPSLIMGENMLISTPKMKIICVPLIICSGGTIELDIAAI